VAPAPAAPIQGTSLGDGEPSQPAPVAATPVTKQHATTPNPADAPGSRDEVTEIIRPPAKGL
jgi:hypothetical protein